MDRDTVREKCCEIISYSLNTDIKINIYHVMKLQEMAF